MTTVRAEMTFHEVLNSICWANMYGVGPIEEILDKSNNNGSEQAMEKI